MKNLIKLPEIVFPKGIGIEDLSARLIKREGRICMYERSDEVWEVFTVKIRKARKIKGKEYPSQEVYPGNEDFGQNAWCFSNFENADKKYNYMVDTAKRIGCRSGGEGGENRGNSPK
jgi:hypothetical protein